MMQLYNGGTNPPMMQVPNPVNQQHPQYQNQQQQPTQSGLFGNVPMGNPFNIPPVVSPSTNFNHAVIAQFGSTSLPQQQTQTPQQPQQNLWGQSGPQQQNSFGGQMNWSNQNGPKK